MLCAHLDPGLSMRPGRGMTEGAGDSYLTVLGQIDLQSFRVVLEAERGHREQNVFTVHGLPLLLLAFL